MTVSLVLGEPFWRDWGVREAEVEIPPERAAAGLTLRELLALAGAHGEAAESWAGEEGPPSVFVNGRAVPGGRLKDLRLRDGDRVVVQLMLSGG
ncbi:MAG: MoaD/ThiS family protein [Actinobacteria bacterium]|nr:MoaD/ThiS family protein [Actinomycetota bacterium]